jgi:hypothetical protein
MSNLGAQFGKGPKIEAGVPPEFGTTPIPPGTVRFNHYTWGRSVPGIKAEGIKRSYSEEKFEHGGTESPQIFATAGHPGRALQDAAHGDKHYIEGYAHIGQLDVGGDYRASHMNDQQLGEHAQRLEANKSVITFHGDVPKEQILAVHEPWHGTFHHLADDPRMERSIMSRDYHGIEPSTDKALDTASMALAAKVMVGGKLQGKSFADMDAEKKKS